MTESTAIVPVAQESKAIERAVGYEAERERYRYLLGLAKGIWECGLQPKAHKNFQQTALTMLAGADYGFSPTQSMTRVVVVNGAVGLDSAGIMAVVRRSGLARLEYKEGEGVCDLTGIRVDSGDTYTSHWDRKRVVETGVNKDSQGRIKDTWRSREREMLRHKCETEVGRTLFPDLLADVYSEDELEGVAAQPEPLPSVSRTETIKQTLGPAKDSGQGAGNVEPSRDSLSVPTTAPAADSAAPTDPAPTPAPDEEGLTPEQVSEELFREGK